MRIFMTRGALEACEMEGGGFRVLLRSSSLVAFFARNRNVCTTQRVARLTVLGKSKSGWVESINRVTILASVLVGQALELAGMRILMTRRAAIELDQVYGRFPSGHVTLRTRDVRVLTLQFVGRLLVVGCGECGRLKTVHRMTRGTFALVSPLRKLTVVSVEVAVGALLEDESLFEVSVHVTLRAIEAFVFAEQRKSRLCVIEPAADGGLGY